MHVTPYHAQLSDAVHLLSICTQKRETFMDERDGESPSHTPFPNQIEA